MVSKRSLDHCVDWMARLQPKLGYVSNKLVSNGWPYTSFENSAVFVENALQSIQIINVDRPAIDTALVDRENFRLQAFSSHQPRKIIGIHGQLVLDSLKRQIA